MEQILEADIRPRVLLYGPEGTGKDTFAKRLIFGGLRDKATNLEVLTIPAEYDDRYVGHLENKAKEFGQAVEEAKRAGSEVGVYLPEIERHFAVGDYHYSWEDKYTAALRDVIHGTQAFPADWVLATTNHLARLGAPLLSRFYKIELPMSLELARGILQTHWPAESANGLSPDYVLERLRQETIAEVTLASRKTAALRAPDLTGFNGRFLRDFAADLETRIKLQRRKQAHFAPDAAFADQILAEHVRAILAPVMEAVGTRAVREFLVTLPDPLDPPVAIKPCLDGFQRARFLAS